MRRIGLLLFPIIVVGLTLSVIHAQDKKKDADKKAPIAPAEKLAEGWDEIDERLIFLMVRLANTETSLEAVEKTIAASSRKQSVKLGDAKRSIGANEKMDHKGGGPMKWSQFYGTTAEKFFYHPTDRNSTYHTVTVLSPQPPQNDNQTAAGIPSRQGLPVHQRPPQFDYIYKANQGAAEKAEAEAALLKGKVDALTARRRKLELEQVALWVEIAFRAAAHFELNKKPVFRFEPLLAANDADAKLHAEIMKTATAFMRVSLAIVDEAPKDQAGTLVRIKPAVSEARDKLTDAWLRLAVDTSDKQSVESKFAALAKRLDDVARNLTESYEIAVDGDRNADELRKDTFRGQLQGSLVSYAQIVLALDEMATQMRDQWKIKPDLDKPYGSVSLAKYESAPKSTEDMKSLQGEWAAIEEEVGGKSFDKQTVKAIDRRIVVNGDLLTMSQMWSNKIGDRLNTHQGPFHIDAATRAFDFMAKTSEGTDVEYRGIYKLSGDRLTICYKYAKGDSTTRPTMFKTEAGSGTVFALAVFKRVTK